MPLSIAPERNPIMSDKSNIMRDRQLAVRREIDRRGIALKAIAFDSGLGMSVLLSYFPNPDGVRTPAVIPMSAVFSLIEGEALPLDLLSLLLPAGFMLVAVSEEHDFHEVTGWMQDFLATKASYHRPDSENAEAIGPQEAEALGCKLAGRIGR